MTEKTNTFKEMFGANLDADKLAIGMITTVVCWFVGSAVSTTYTKLIIEPKSLAETTE